MSFLGTINFDYSRLSFDYIACSANNTGEHCVFVIYIHKGKCTTLIFILLLFGLSHQTPLKHICYYFNHPTPYLWTLTWFILCYLQYICRLQDQYNRNYSRLLFEYIAYSANNMGERCILVIYIHKVKCGSLIFILLRFGLLNE